MFRADRVYTEYISYLESNRGRPIRSKELSDEDFAWLTTVYMWLDIATRRLVAMGWTPDTTMNMRRQLSVLCSVIDYNLISRQERALVGELGEIICAEKAGNLKPLLLKELPMSDIPDGHDCCICLHTIGLHNPADGDCGSAGTTPMCREAYHWSQLHSHLVGK